MAYPEDQGLNIPRFPGWKLIDWFNDPIVADSDVFTTIGRHPTESGSSTPLCKTSVHGAPPKTYWGDSAYMQTYCVYRRDKVEWVKIGDDAILREGDVLVLPGVHPDASLAKNMIMFGPHGYCHCGAPPFGYGNGKMTPAIIRSAYANTNSPEAKFTAYRMVENGKGERLNISRLPPNPERLTRPLPLP